MNEAHTYQKYIKSIGEVLIPFVIYYVIYFLALIGLTSLVITIMQGTGESWQSLLLKQEPTVNAVIGGFAMVIGIVPLIPMFRQEICHEGDEKGSAKAGTLTGRVKIFLTMVLAVTASVAVNILFIFFHLTENSEAYVRTAEHQYSVIFPFGLFLYGIISPLAEEVVFRGIIYNRIKRHMPVIVSMILSSFLFGIYHGNTVQALYGFCMGMLIAYTYEMFGEFFYAFLFHASANIAVYTITGNSHLYELIIKPYVGIVLAGIAALPLAFMERNKKLKCQTITDKK